MRSNPKRFLYMFLVGIVVGLVLNLLLPNRPPDGHMIFHYLSSAIITILVWEGNLRIDTVLNRRFSWLVMPGKRILVQFPISMVYSAITIFVSMLIFDSYVCKIPNTSREVMMVSALTVGLLITILLLAIEIGAQFFGNWKQSLVEVEKYKTESVQAQLQNLKNQVNPHFLFNNMSVLSSLVYKDQDKAVDFINQLSKVYRYLLDNGNSESVTLETELNFIKSYNYLLQIRFDTNISFEMNIAEEKLKTYIPPMALQMLIENCIKHNEISSEQPLHISIKTVGDKLEVSNNLQLRSNTEPSSKTGLKNIKERYTYFTDKPVEVIQEAKTFTVRIPLLHLK